MCTEYTVCMCTRDGRNACINFEKWGKLQIEKCYGKKFILFEAWPVRLDGAGKLCRTQHTHTHIFVPYARLINVAGIAGFTFRPELTKCILHEIAHGA